MQQYLKIVGNGRKTARDLTLEEAEAACTLIMEGRASLAQVAAFMAALRIKEESVDELTAFTRAIRRYCQQLPGIHPHLIDICVPYDGRSKMSLLLVASAITAAACGVSVGLHGRTGQTTPPKFGISAGDILQALAIPVHLSLEAAGAMLQHAQIAFVNPAQFAPQLEHFNQVRLDYGIRSFFNTAEKLLNPFGAAVAITGIFHYPVMERVAQTMHGLGYTRGLAVQGPEGSIEALTGRRTPIVEFKNQTGELQAWTIDPADFGWWEKTDIDMPLTIENQAALTRQILNPAAHITPDLRHSTALTAGLMLYSAGLTGTLAGGVQQALDTLNNGQAHNHLLRLQKETHYA